MNESIIPCAETTLPLQATPTACYLVSATPPGEVQACADNPGTLRSTSRPDTLTAQRIEVGLVLHAMLGVSAATDYFNKHDVCQQIAKRVLSPNGSRRGTHDANGIRTGSSFSQL